MSEKLYAERDIVEQGDYYSRHTSAMTGEGLHSKSDIAAELAHRDIEIARLQSEVERLRGREAELEDQLDRPRIALLKERTELRGRLTECHQSIDAYVRDNERLQGLIDEADKATPALILRKQAEAVEAEAREWNPDDQTYSGRKPHKEMIAYAQRLRQQADEVSDGT